MDELKKEDAIAMFFAGRLIELINNFYVKTPNEFLTKLDYNGMKKLVWAEVQVIFNIEQELENE